MRQEDDRSNPHVYRLRSPACNNGLVIRSYNIIFNMLVTNDFPWPNKRQALIDLMNNRKSGIRKITDNGY